MNINRDDLLLYAVTDRSWLGEKTLCQCLEEALKGGVTFVQLREKHLDDESLIKQALEIKQLCKKYNVPFVINDRVNIAKKVDADGVHIGQNDMELRAVRKILGRDKIIGVTAKTVEQALSAEQNGADYLGVGAVFPTTSKADAKGISRLTFREIRRAVNIPVAAIGGISEENVTYLKDYGMDGIAVISGIFAQKNIEKAAKNLKAKVIEIIGK